MTIQEAIKKAVEGGWENTLPKITPHNPENDAGKASVLNALLRKQYLPMALLDPLFWQALGRAMGWDSATLTHFGNGYQHYSTWQSKWHKLIDHLADGGSIESFFETLT